MKRWYDCCVWTSKAMHLKRWNYYHEPIPLNSSLSDFCFFYFIFLCVCFGDTHSPTSWESFWKTHLFPIGRNHISYCFFLGSISLFLVHTSPQLRFNSFSLSFQPKLMKQTYLRTQVESYYIHIKCFKLHSPLFALIVALLLFAVSSENNPKQLNNAFRNNNMRKNVIEI